jgi:hypothetical protein
MSRLKLDNYGCPTIPVEEYWTRKDLFTLVYIRRALTTVITLIQWQYMHTFWR